jgi:hypothetical protein
LFADLYEEVTGLEVDGRRRREGGKSALRRSTRVANECLCRK